MLIAILEGISMDIRVNDTLWHIQFKKPTSSELKRSDGTISLGVTDNTTKTITIADNASDYMADKILCHELVHVYSFHTAVTST